MRHIVNRYHGDEQGKLIFAGTELLHINGMFHLETLQNRRLVILLASTELLHNACSFEFAFEFLQSTLYVLTVFYWYNNHFLLIFKCYT